MFMRCKGVYVVDVLVNIYVTPFLFASLDHTSMLGCMWGCVH
jgi:hypothetical protein